MLPSYTFRGFLDQPRRTSLLYPPPLDPCKAHAHRWRGFELVVNACNQNFYHFLWLLLVSNICSKWIGHLARECARNYWKVQVYVINLLYLLKTRFSIVTVFKINFVDNHNFITFTNFLIFISWFISLLNTCESLWIRNKQKKYSLWKKSIQQYIMLTWIS